MPVLMLDRSGIERLRVSRGVASRSRAALKGAGIGFLIGLGAEVAYYLAIPYMDADGWEALPMLTFALTGWPALVMGGSTLGALNPGHVWEDIPLSVQFRSAGTSPGVVLSVSFP